jgi:hypothetical protein
MEDFTKTARHVKYSHTGAANLKNPDTGPLQGKPGIKNRVFPVF